MGNDLLLFDRPVFGMVWNHDPFSPCEAEELSLKVAEQLQSL